MAPGICLWAYGSGHTAPGIWRLAYCSGRTQETVRAQRLVAHNVHVGNPKVLKSECAQCLVNREVHRCVLWIANCYANVTSAAFGGKLAVKRVHVQRLVNKCPFWKQAPALKPCCE